LGLVERDADRALWLQDGRVRMIASGPETTEEYRRRAAA
jgi:hypothetical protein